MTLKVAEFIRSLCPDFRWLNRENKKAIKQVYEEELKTNKAHIAQCNQDHIQANQTITAWSQRWALELTHEAIDRAIKGLQKSCKRYGWIIGSLKGRRDTKQGISDLDIQNAKDTSIETLYEGQLRITSRLLSGRCPFHKENTPSFVIYKGQNTWHCFGACGEGGDVIDFVKKLRGVGFLEAVKFLVNH